MKMFGSLVLFAACILGLEGCAMTIFRDEGVQIGDVAIVMLVVMVVGLVIMFRVIGRGNHK